MGVAGSGKTTIGQALSAKTSIPFFDADDFHSLANKEKMRAGKPLDDEDRKEWLHAINQLAINESGNRGAIIACSALKERYRLLLTEGITEARFVFLQGNFDLLLDRIKARKGHFMPDTLLQSQFDTLEPPANALKIDVTRPAHEVVELIQQEFYNEL
jgi:carbohydrate kinase (thermoresistant glucokinase family)